MASEEWREGKRKKRSGEQIEEAVPGAGEGEGPGVAAAEAEWSGGKVDGLEGGARRVSADLSGQPGTEPGGSGEERQVANTTPSAGMPACDRICGLTMMM